MKPKTDYFAEELLAKLDMTDPVYAAYEAQDVSREVGFDFKDFQATLERALDEIREALEASEEAGAEGREHYGDEIADIIFSLVNLARHAGISDLPSFDELLARAGKLSATPIQAIREVGEEMQRVGILNAEQLEGFQPEMQSLFNDGTVRAIEIALAEGFDPKRLLTENVRKYLQRCADIESLAAQDDKQWADLAANNEIITYWKRAKSLN